MDVPQSVGAGAEESHSPSELESESELQLLQVCNYSLPQNTKKANS